jgi:hypothetical protein
MSEPYYIIRRPQSYDSSDPVLTQKRFNRLRAGEEAYIEFRAQHMNSDSPHFSGTLVVTVPPYKGTLQSGGETTTVEGNLIYCDEVNGPVKLVFYSAMGSFLLLPQ